MSNFPDMSSSVEPVQKISEETEILVADLTVEFRPEGGEQETAIKNATLEIPNEKIHCIVGKSGCGKTTLLKCILGLYKEGKENPFMCSSDFYVNSEQIAYVQQVPALLPWRTLRQNASLGAEVADGIGKGVNGRISKNIRRYGLKDHEHKFPSDLSGGMQKRTALIRALETLAEGTERKLLVCDEPFSGVDFVTRLRLSRLFKGQVDKKGITTVIVTHDIEEAIFLGDYVTVMDEGGSVNATYSTNLGEHELDRLGARKSDRTQSLFDTIWNELE